MCHTSPDTLQPARQICTALLMSHHGSSSHKLNHPDPRHYYKICQLSISHIFHVLMPAIILQGGVQENGTALGQLRQVREPEHSRAQVEPGGGGLHRLHGDHRQKLHEEVQRRRDG